MPAASRVAPIPFPFRLRTLSRCVALCSGVVFGALMLPPAQAETPSTATTAIAIPAGDLGEALNRFARAAGVTLSFTPEQVRGLKTSGLSGVHSVQSGFDQLLRGTGLQAEPGGEGYVLVRREGAVTLAPVKVRVAGLSSATEGSGSYTATGPSSTATGLGLTLRETPQSISVLSRQRLDDQNLTTLNNVMKATPGVSVLANGVGGDEGFGLRLVECLNIGTVIGLPVAIAAYFWANRLLPVELPQRGDWEVHAMFATWGVMLAHAALRPAVRAWVEQLGIAALAFGLLPLLNAITTVRGLHHSIGSGDWVFAGFDLSMLALALLAVWGVWRVSRRPLPAAEAKPRARRAVGEART